MAQPPNHPDPAPLDRRDGGLRENLRDWMVRYGPALRTYFRKKVGPTEADDLVQDVFVNLQDRGRVDDIEHVNRYLFRVAANVLARRRQRRTWDWAGHAALEEAPLPGDELSPERILIGRERLNQLMAALGQLPPRMAEAFVLHRFDEMTYAEIGRRMGVSVRTVEVFIARAAVRVSAMLEAVR